MSKSDWSALIAILLLFFLFSGEPDVWDRLRERVMLELQNNFPKEK